ncbi:hypothetical protein DLJ53_07510 [Acuticoccus sediminis]|uniref:MIP18 family-like domain-containing protein n=1 Tax=Acuticoccus sediminis TaxID=2184697 RepID=A0A8B2NZN0_9HYPH|nr:iron-sulfur cluster assembly protein [Acuticoccus sediminis]RAI04281.1 hypothetical protein DLJ53_07510 [Acuticoccus sediminis]
MAGSPVAAPPVCADAVARALASVMDPELDEPVTEMGFVEDVAIEGAHVAVSFRLPTYWCSPNFAYLMLEDIHRALAAVPGVVSVDVVLEDHLYGEALAEAVRTGRGFEEVVGPDLAGDDLAALRRTFEDKAFLRRQEAVLLDLKRQGLSDVAITAMTLDHLDAARFEHEDARRRAPLYRALLAKRGLARAADDPAFVTLTGEPIRAAGLWEHLRRLRQVRINMEFSGALCRGLKSARYKHVVRDDGTPTLVDFLPGEMTQQP